MLTRLRVSGFKNLVDVDVRFGPFTCIAGPNGAGKSNLFNAIQFLSATAEKTLMEAALSVRDETGKSGDIRSLFHRAGERCDEGMTFEAEMLVPRKGKDDLGQPAEATSTFLRYTLKLGVRNLDGHAGPEKIEVREEKLDYITLGQSGKHLPFLRHRKHLRSSVLKSQRRGSPFISTDREDGQTVILQHQDGGGGGRPRRYSAGDLPRTVLSTANAAEAPTATLARRELQSWRLLQLEPSALRRPDGFLAPSSLGTDGSHLAATLFRLAHESNSLLPAGASADAQCARVYAEVANTLSDLIDDVRDVFVERDEKRELYTLFVVDGDGTAHPARDLSDGTLRFLALAVTKLDPEALGVICLEEPENGIHPARIDAILRLLQETAVDLDEPIGADNPLRQVIINTHSPAVVMQVPEDALVVASLRETVREGRRFKIACFRPLAETWRARALEKTHQGQTVLKGELLAYLNPVVPPVADGWAGPERQAGPPKRRARNRVVDRKDMLPFLPFPPAGVAR